MAQKTILAVAIGETDPNLPPITGSPPPPGVRPYIKGLINALPGIGSDPGYIIKYHECPVSGLDALFKAEPSPDIVFCMSVRVVEHAKNSYPNTMPIVGVVSDHTPYAGTNVTGFSAKRTDAALDGYLRFLATAPTLSAVHVLHHQGHPPSQRALARIQAAFPSGPYTPHVVRVDEGLGSMTAILNAAGILRTAGVFVLPIDRCFGAVPEIIRWQNAHGVPTFWPVTDWVDTTSTGAFAGYGVPQEHCGERMGAKIASYWTNNVIPPFEDCQPSDFKWKASSNTAAALGVVLGPTLQIT